VGRGEDGGPCEVEGEGNQVPEGYLEDEEDDHWDFAPVGFTRITVSAFDVCRDIMFVVSV